MKKKFGNKDVWIAYGLILPALLVFAIFMFYPFFYTVYLSFFDWNMIKPVKEFIGLANYKALFADPLMPLVIKNTVEYILILLVLNCVAPYVLAFVLSFVIKRGRGFYKGAFFLPSVISLVVGSILYLWVLNPVSGPAAILAEFLGINIPIWSKTQGLVIVVLSIITTWKIFGYNFIVIFGGVSGVPQEIIEAAKIDNVPLYKIFFDIVLPMSSATGVYIFIMTIVQGLQYVFTPVKVVTQGGPDNASSNIIYNIYQEGFVFYHTGYASAMSIVAMVLFIVLLVIEFRYVEKGIYYEN
ncbi:carbohydrate ABC transporter permease [Pectinatus cerevisiiphilus]|uniref:Carbohydrate ABC transporter membrane protein 1 (CUT1 family) n=1 Tax=Pectinatus cerevisiiphilus TaxID=86956 RepID=A0A4R3KEZ2_9FIRM|nr:sugar ABC transporter permease [Pectinatus cerevisiiphilus]TCS81847.1 carbohydrate ABC transporter membrane protein 1 (CUT1 family) [Pectinatus cerevisiiphilus]